MSSFLKAVAAASLLLGAAGVADAQDVSPSIGSVQSLIWRGCGVEEVTLQTLAELARPALWFSRDEPLRDRSVPREWFRQPAVQPGPLVYYRVRTLKANGPDDSWSKALMAQLGLEPGGITNRRAKPAIIKTIKWTPAMLGDLRQIVVRYLFYYPAELGTGEHLHDLESAELDLEPVFDAKSRCAEVRLRKVYGSAHGLGLYTNVLDVNAADQEDADIRARLEQVLPGILDPAPSSIAITARPKLILLVEEGKHATAPDRNGDGVYTPGFDVNDRAFDAWGIRDAMRSKVLTPSFQGEMFKPRRPLASDFVSSYTLQLATDDRLVCGGFATERERNEHMEKVYVPGIPQQGINPFHLLKGKGFCDDTVVESKRNIFDVTAALGLGGAYNGYTRWWERISGSLRWDGGFGWTGTVPRGFSLPGIGGWTVVRLSGPWPGHEARKSIDLLYMPSSSRLLDWYTGGGIDWGTYQNEEGRRVAFEGGIKFRVPVESVFLGARVGIRTNYVDPLRTPRLIIEAGAGIW